MEDVLIDSYEKDFTNIEWNSKPLLSNPFLWWQDYWNAKTWIRWHSKVAAKYGVTRANEVLLIWWNRAPVVSFTTDFRSSNTEFINYAKKNGFYDGLFDGVLGKVIGKPAGTANKILDAAGNVVDDAGTIIEKATNITDFLANNFILIVIVLIIALVWIKK